MPTICAGSGAGLVHRLNGGDFSVFVADDLLGCRDMADDFHRKGVVFAFAAQMANMGGNLLHRRGVIAAKAPRYLSHSRA